MRAALIVAFLLAAGAAGARNWVIDPDASAIRFVYEANDAPAEGRFEAVSGEEFAVVEDQHIGPGVDIGQQRQGRDGRHHQPSGERELPPQPLLGGPPPGQERSRSGQ